MVREPAAATDAGSDAWWRTTLRDDGYVASLNALPPLQRVRLLKRGVPAATLPALARDLGMSKERLYATLGLARATVDRRLRADQRLTPDESERVFGIARLVGQVAEVVETSGDPTGFDAAKWLATWLDQPVPALGGLTPGSLLDTAEGREIVSGLIARMQSGAYT